MHWEGCGYMVFYSVILFCLINICTKKFCLNLLCKKFLHKSFVQIKLSEMFFTIRVYFSVYVEHV